MAERVEWIRDPATLAARLQRVGDGPLALDTEADSLHHYPEKVCLIQLSFGGVDYLVDPLAQFDPAPLGTLLADSARRKILHGADYDLRVLNRDFGLTVRGLFDTMVAARLTGETALGLASLLARHFDVRLDKRFQRADWSRRPMPEAMERYAALDTRHLEPLAELLEQRLRELGRLEWAAEEFRMLERVRWTPAPDEEAFRRVKGSHAIDRRQLAILRELHAMRDRAARERDRPPFKVLRDEVLLAVARAAPRDGAQLGQVAGIPASWRHGARVRLVLEAVSRARSMPQSELPETHRRQRGTRLGQGEQARVVRLRRFRDRLAGELGLDPSVVAPRAVLEGIASRAERGEDPAGTPELRDWQRELLRPVIRLLD